MHVRLLDIWMARSLGVKSSAFSYPRYSSSAVGDQLLNAFQSLRERSLSPTSRHDTEKRLVPVPVPHTEHIAKGQGASFSRTPPSRAPSSSTIPFSAQLKSLFHDPKQDYHDRTASSRKSLNSCDYALHMKARHTIRVDAHRASSFE
jgi:hypothetical protein